MARQHLFTINGRHIWLSVVEQNLFVKMAPSGMAARDDNGGLTIECADGSSRPCGFDPDAVRERISSLERLGLLIRIPHKGWSLTNAGRRIWAELMAQSGAALPSSRATTFTGVGGRPGVEQFHPPQAPQR
jgi:hypothetical protein